MHTLLTMVGLPDLSLLPLVLLLAMIGLAILLFGWIADLLLGSAAFGTLLNSVIVLVGAFAGTWLWQRYGFPTRFDPLAVRAAVATGSGLLLVLLLAVTLP
jgi:uncharacterized membrane protein YeaQ/YmgE (transglycosylase-associated protein family)